MTSSSYGALSEWDIQLFLKAFDKRFITGAMALSYIIISASLVNSYSALLTAHPVDVWVYNFIHYQLCNIT